MKAKQTPFARAARGRLLLLAIVLASLWLLADPLAMSGDEQALWEKVRAAQLHLWDWRTQQGVETPEESDPWGCGLIGLEWSGITTTLGDLEAKRTACNPAWAVQFSRWFGDLDLAPGDPVAIYSSASFPGLLLSAIAAAEAMQLDPLLIVSLGASTWGANHPDAPWPTLEAELRRGGFIMNQADFYTLGGGAELGHGMDGESIALLHNAANAAGVGVLTAPGLAEMITLKSELLAGHRARVLVNVGGSHANLGDEEEILRLSRGLVPAGEKDRAGNGVIAYAMQHDIPVIHMLNIRAIANAVGIPFDATPSRVAPVRIGPWWALGGLALFFAALATHRRWRLEEAGAHYDRH
ncbi:MAG: poly-gamma-glutamate system protein [Lysobacterales bacterium]